MQEEIIEHRAAEDAVHQIAERSTHNKAISRRLQAVGGAPGQDRDKDRDQCQGGNQDKTAHLAVLPQQAERYPMIPGWVIGQKVRHQNQWSAHACQNMFDHKIEKKRADGKHRRQRTARRQWAASQLSAARASTTSGTEISTAGSAAFSITRATSFKVASTSFSGASKINSSWTCNSILAESFFSASA